MDDELSRFEQNVDASAFYDGDGDGDVYPENEYLAPVDDDYAVPDSVKSYLQQFYAHFRDRNTYELASHSDSRFAKISEKHFKDSPWPAPETVAQYVDNDAVFLALYKELYFRHIFVKLRPSLKDRFDSFANYSELFEAVLRQPDAPRAADFELPAQWAWDMVDEFVYQFENFCHYRDHCENLSADEVQQLKANADAWSAPRVLHCLNALVAKSKIRVVKPTEEEEAAPGLLRLMGYFASIALMRVHFLLGDFASALRALEPINFRKKAAWLRVPGCHVTTYYYLGFSYLLMHRYVDVIKIFSNILSYLARARQSGRTHFSSSVDKKESRIYFLLAIAWSMCPLRIDEALLVSLKDKCGVDIWNKLQKNDVSAFEALFTFAKPSFVNVGAPAFDAAHDVSLVAYRRHVRAFAAEIGERLQLNQLYHMLKLYSSVSIAKLARLVEPPTSEQVLRDRLLSLKHKSRALRWQSGSPSSGVLESSGELNFFLDHDMVHVSENKVPRKYGEFFIRHINKFQEMSAEIGRI